MAGLFGGMSGIGRVEFHCGWLSERRCSPPGQGDGKFRFSYSFSFPIGTMRLGMRTPMGAGSQLGEGLPERSGRFRLEGRDAAGFSV